MKKLNEYNISNLFDLSEDSFNKEWYSQVVEDVLEKQLKGTLSIKRISINFNLSDRNEESISEKIAIEVPNINIYHEIYLSNKLIGYYSYFLDLEYNFLDEFIYYKL